MADVEPAGHQKPGSHAPEQEELYKPSTEPNLPAGHKNALPSVQYNPGRQGRCADPFSMDSWPMATEIGKDEPTGQKKARSKQGMAVEFTDPSGQ